MRRVLLGWLLLAAACGADGSRDVPYRTPLPFGGNGGGFTEGAGGFTEGDGGSFAGGSTGGGFPFVGAPYTQPIVKADPPPPPISGGTLLVFGNGKTAAVSDPDHDQILIVDLERLRISFAIALSPGDEPGRLVEDGAARVHAVLRGGGALASIDPAAGKVLVRRTICGSPRGAAYDKTADSVHVACAGGELVTLPAAGGDVTRQLELDRDLRDVVVDGESLWISRFRSAEVLRLDATGHVAERFLPPSPSDDSGSEPASAPEVAWRMIPAPGGGVLVVHQTAMIGDVPIGPGGYSTGIGCGRIVETAVTLFRSGQKPHSSNAQLMAPLPVDIAQSSDRSSIAIASAGGIPVLAGGSGASITVTTFDALNLTERPTASSFECNPPGTASPPGQTVAVAFLGGTLVVQTREPSLLVVGSNAVSLPGASRRDTGHDLFHLATQTGIACASCHPEGKDDGRVWSFASVGQRRT